MNASPTNLVRLAAAAILSIGVAGTTFSQEVVRERFEFTSYRDIDQLFGELNYTPEAWQAGIREVPRVFITTIPARWKDKTTQEISVQHKKRLFFRAMAPLVLRTNELTLEDRATVKTVRSATGGDALTAQQQQMLDPDLDDVEHPVESPGPAEIRIGYLFRRELRGECEEHGQPAPVPVRTDPQKVVEVGGPPAGRLRSALVVARSCLRPGPRCLLPLQPGQTADEIPA